MEEEKKKLLLLQSVLRVWVAARTAEKRIKRHMMRTRAANELLETELSYLRDLRTLHQEFQLGSLDILSAEEQKHLYMNLKEIIPIHTALVKELQLRMKKWSYHQTIAEVLQQQLEGFKIYEHYVTNYREAAIFLQKQRESGSKLHKFFQAREANAYCRGLKFESFLVMPVQRLPRYILLLKELRKYTDPTHPDSEHITAVMKELDELARKFNEAQRDKDTSLKVSQIMNTVLGAEMVTLESPFIYEGPITYKKIKRLKQGFVRSLSKKSTSFVGEKWQDLWVYLFTDTMLCAKKITTSAKTIIGALNGKGYYKFSKTKAHSLKPTTQIEVSAEDPCTFTLAHDYEYHEFKTATPQVRDLWINAFNKTLVSFGQRRHTTA